MAIIRQRIRELLLLIMALLASAQLAAAPAAGAGYALTEQASLPIGDGYFDFGTVSSELTTAGVPNGSYGQGVHGNELSAALRVNFHTLP